ncbi:MAG: hypothetical protein IPK70_15270 [Flavobacteriales bacterium]|nr:hypothetical protein [Flavobacteriales bacterium]
MERPDLIARAEHDGLAFEIVSDNPDLGYYFFVYEGEKCTHDYVLDTVAQCKEFGEERFNVPVNAWKESR